MDNPQPLPLSLLNLSSEQINILNAHALAAVQAMAGIRFTEENKFDMMLMHAFESGKLAMCQSLVVYDEEQLKARQEQIHNPEGEA